MPHDKDWSAYEKFRPPALRELLLFILNILVYNVALVDGGDPDPEHSCGVFLSSSIRGTWVVSPVPHLG